MSLLKGDDMSIPKIRERWNKDKNHFSQKEIGELQDFIKDILQDSEIFGLKKGYGSTSNKNRQHEFTIETTKKGRHADFIIFINGEDVVIPVEVEKHNNIKKGIEQVFQYQKDWDKKYAILTDGNEWRFYRSNKFKSFNINYILNNTDDFLIYWREYIKPENYYIDLFSLDNQEKSENINLNLQENRILFFDDITRVISNFRIKMRAIGAFKNLSEQPENEKIAIETSYAYLIPFILYKVLVDNGYKKFQDEYNNTITKIQKAIRDKDFYVIIINEVKKISEYVSKYIYIPFDKEQKSINEKLIENLKDKLTIEDISPWLDIILFIDRYDFSGIKNEIFGYIYENYLKELYEGKHKGQYFTDATVVNLMLKEIGYTEKNIRQNIKDNKISIIDPSCGAGTFLYSAVDKVINTFDDGTETNAKFIEELIDKNIFGFDIEEFPLYLAEMNILMRMLPLIVNDNYENPIDNKLKIFKTKDSISEFLDSGINSKEKNVNLFDHLEKTALDYPSFMREEEDLEDLLKTLQENGGVRERFDYVIGNPPYIDYNVCSRQKVEFVRKIQDKKDNTINMGNVYGMNLNTANGRIKNYSPKPNLFAFFIALGLALLKDNGRLCYIIPQTILTARDLDVLRYHLSSFTTINEIITFDANLFIGRGLKQNRPVSTSSLIIKLQKKNPSNNHKVNIINHSSYMDNEGIDVEEYIKNSKKTKRKLSQRILLEEIANWNFIKHDDKFFKYFKEYQNNTQSIEMYRRNGLPNYDYIMLDGYININNKEISKEKLEDSYLIPKLKKGSLYISKYRFFDKKGKIKRAQGSQDPYRLIKLKYKILWRYQNPNGFHFSDRENVLPNYGVYSIASEDKNEILFFLSILSSSLITKLFEYLFKNDNEKSFLLGLTVIKEFVRIPKIDNHNKHIKQEIIKTMERLISIEKLKLKDVIKFDVTKQKFDSVSVNKHHIILNDKDYVKKIKIKSKTEVVKNTINKFNKKKRSIITLNELKFLKLIDNKERNNIKDYLNDLIFALYFNIEVKEIGIQNANHIKRLCQKMNTTNTQS